MIGLLFLAGSIAWLLVAFVLALWLPSLLGVKRFGWLASALLFPALVVVPIADELMAQWQFYRLCKREAVMDIRPTWKEVTRASYRDIPLRPNGYIVSVRGTRAEYSNIDTREIFFVYTSYMRTGGVLYRYLLWDDLANDYCKPEGLHEIYKKMNIDQLLQNGKDR